MRCKNGPEHTHQTVEESRRCWASRYTSMAPAAPVAAFPAPTPLAPSPVPAYTTVRRITSDQLAYIRNLGGDTVWAAKLTLFEASQYIDRLKAEQTEQRSKRVTDPRMKLIEGMIDMIPEGYYATAADGEGAHVDFVRITRVTKPTRKYPVGTLKIQTQHSDLWQVALVHWPSGYWSIYKPSVIPMVLLVIADYKTCARRYAIELQSCMRCNKQLTDDRSRHYLVGPECENKHHFTWPIAYADEQNGGLSFEQLVARGLPTRVWQDQQVA